MSESKHHAAHHLAHTLSHQLSHFVASVGFTLGVLAVGLVGTWVVRSVLTESRGAHQAGRVAGASVESAITGVTNTSGYSQQQFQAFPLQLGDSQILLAYTYHQYDEYWYTTSN